MSRPTPGHPNTVSTNTDPASTPGSASAKRMSSVGSAFASTCRACTARAGTPFATAVRTHCSCSSSTTDVRAYRAIPAAPTSVSVSTGSIAWRSEIGKSRSRPTGSRTPNAGSRSHVGKPKPRRAIREQRDQRERQPEARRRVHRRRRDRERAVEPCRLGARPGSRPASTPSTKVSASEMPAEREEIGIASPSTLVTERCATKLVPSRP